MATVKIKFRASSVGMKEGTLFFQVIHKRVARQVSTGLKLYSYEWDAAHGGVVLPPDADDVRRAYLVALEERAVRGVDGLRNIVMRLERCGRDYTYGRQGGGNVFAALGLRPFPVVWAEAGKGTPVGGA